MTSAAFVNDADQKARWMVQREARCPGDTTNAMRRVADRHGISYGALWTLRYRKPADILLSVYLSICTAYEAEVVRQERIIEHERAIAHAKTGVGAALLRLADKLDRVADQVRGSQDATLTVAKPALKAPGEPL